MATNWISVLFLAGAAGFQFLSGINHDYINYGEPVTGADSSAVTLNDTTNVGQLIEDTLPYEDSPTDILVKYKAKSAVTGAFSYLKLVGKIGSIPESVEDGDVSVNLNPNKKSKTITNLQEDSKYYFVIFAEDTLGNQAQSEPKSIKTGVKPIPPVPEGIFKSYIQVSSTPSESDFIEDVSYEKVTS